MATESVVMRKSGNEFVACQAKRLSDFGDECDGLGKSAIFDAMAFYLTSEEMDTIGQKIYDRAKADAEAMQMK